MATESIQVMLLAPSVWGHHLDPGALMHIDLWILIFFLRRRTLLWASIRFQLE